MSTSPLKSFMRSALRHDCLNVTWGQLPVSPHDTAPAAAPLAAPEHFSFRKIWPFRGKGLSLQRNCEKVDRNMNGAKFSEGKGSSVLTAGSEVPALVDRNVSVNADDAHVPIGMPQSVAEALADLEEGEREFEHKETFSHVAVMQMIWDKIGGHEGRLQ